jgi:hypothetical protein
MRSIVVFVLMFQRTSFRRDARLMEAALEMGGAMRSRKSIRRLRTLLQIIIKLVESSRLVLGVARPPEPHER